MKILIFNWRCVKHPQAGGAENYLHEQAKFWLKKHQVKWICGGFKGCKEKENIEGIEIIRVGGKFSLYIKAPLYFLRKLRNWPDVIIDAENAIPFFTPFFSKKPKILLIHHIHKTVFSKELPKLLAVLAYIFEIKLMPIAYKKVKFVTVSESSKKEILENRLTKKPVKIIYNGIKMPDKVKKFKKSKNPLIIYLGRLKKYKSLDIAIKAFSLLRKDIPKLKFIIIGRGDDEERLKALAKKLNLKERVLFKGFLSENEKNKLLQEAWFTVNPSFIEGWSVTTIEANSFGVPAIGSNVKGLKDSIVDGKTGLLFKYGDIKELAEKMKILIKNVKLRKRLSKNAIAWSKNFSWENSAEKFLKELESLVKEKWKNQR